MLEEHWIAYPRFVAGELTWLERTKLRIAGRPTLRFLDTLLPSTDATFEESTLRKYGVTDLQFVLIVPGGGSDHKGALRAPDIVLDAARRLAAAGNRTLLVGAANGENDEDIPLTRLPRIPFADVVALMRRALVVVSNGGDTLLQSIACQRPTVAFPIAGDQALRIERCVRAGLAEGTELHSQSIERATLDMLADGARLRALETRLRSAGISNGMETVMDAVGNVLGMT
jgi:UDP:flavonoid glycosyltransferase YjiC (YdhE family)